jgi:hypothetical protein
VATVFIIDEIVAKPGHGRALLEAYRGDYAPGAIARGMALKRIVVAPPIWLDQGSNRLLAIWTVEGAAGWWGQAVQARYDPAVERFWQAAEALIATRNRFFAAEEDDVAALCDV